MFFPSFPRLNQIFSFGCLRSHFEMAMAFHSLVTFFVFCEVLCTVCCEKDPFNPFSSQLDPKAELKTSELAKNDVFENPVEKRTIEKRRLTHNEGENNSALTIERQFEHNNILERRRNGFSESDNENETPSYQQKNEWEFGRKFSFPTKPVNFRNPAEFRARQPFTDQMISNQKFNEKTDDVFETKSSRWNEGRNFKYFSDPEDPKINQPFNGRAPASINENETDENIKANSGNFPDRRISLTTFNDMKMRNDKNYNYESDGEKQFPYLGHSSMQYFSRYPHSFWHSNVHKPEKEVVINFNTECPTTRQFNNKLVHKFFFAPKSPLSPQRSHHEISNIHIPETAFITGRKMIPVYYV